MKKILALLTPLLLLLGIITVSATALDTHKTVIFTSTNVVTLNTEVDNESVTSTILALESSTSPELYLYIDSPGGSVIDGIVLVNYLQHSKKPIQCVASYAASMAHAILEACPLRFGTSTNVLMQHKISGGASGSPSEIEGVVKIMKSLENFLNIMESKRIGITVEEFARRTSLPWYTTGEESVKENVIDAIVDVSCDASAYKINIDKTVKIGPFAFKVRYNGCPLLPGVEIPMEGKK